MAAMTRIRRLPTWHSFGELEITEKAVSQLLFLGMLYRTLQKHLASRPVADKSTKAYFG